MHNQQVTDQAKRADEIIESLKNLANPQENLVTAASEVEVLDKATDLRQPGEQPDGKPVEATSAPVEQTDYETRFKRYKASTDITIRDLRQKVYALESMESENDQLKKQLENAQAQIPSTPNEMLEMFSTEEVSAFDKMVEGKVGGLKSEVDRLNKELDETRKGKQANDKKNAHKNLVERVASVVPNYQEVNNSKEFSDYMNDLDEYGNLRLEMLIKAKEATPPDVGRIIQFFQDFADSNAVQEAPADERRTYTQQELLQNPTSTSSASPESPQGLGIVWDTATTSQLYKDKATNKISNTQFLELEADMRRSKGWQT